MERKKTNLEDFSLEAMDAADRKLIVLLILSPVLTVTSDSIFSIIRSIFFVFVLS